jgi:hypothetical protein
MVPAGTTVITMTPPLAFRVMGGEVGEAVLVLGADRMAP